MEPSNMNYDDLKNKIKPLDCIVFKGAAITSGAVSILEKIFTGDGEWTHVGIVINSDVVPFRNGEPNKLYIWESTLSKSGKAINVETGKPKFGVMIRVLDDVISKYNKKKDSAIGYCELIDNPLCKKEDESEETHYNRVNYIKGKLREYYLKHHDDLYESNPFSLGKSLCSCFPSYRTTNYIFCSELVADIYRTIGVYDENLDPETVAPSEFVVGPHSKILNSPIIIEKDQITEA